MGTALKRGLISGAKLESAAHIALGRWRCRTPGGTGQGCKNGVWATAAGRWLTQDLGGLFWAQMCTDWFLLWGHRPPVMDMLWPQCQTQLWSNKSHLVPCFGQKVLVIVKIRTPYLHARKFVCLLV